MIHWGEYGWGYGMDEKEREIDVIKGYVELNDIYCIYRIPLLSLVRRGEEES